MKSIEKLRDLLSKHGKDVRDIDVSTHRMTYYFDDDHAAWATISVTLSNAMYGEPAIVVEPNSAPIDKKRFTKLWLSYGAKEVWFVNQDERVIVIYTENEEHRLGSDEVLTTNVLPGFQCHISELFDD